MSIRKNAQALTSFIGSNLKTMGLKRKIGKRQSQVRDIQAGKDQLSSVLQGGAKGGFSGRAAGNLASDPSAFSGGGTGSRRKGGGDSFR